MCDLTKQNELDIGNIDFYMHPIDVCNSDLHF